MLHIHTQENGSNSKEAAGRLEAVWAHKSTLNRGLAMFNHGNPVKAMQLLVQQGIVEDSAQVCVCGRGGSGKSG